MAMNLFRIKEFPSEKSYQDAELHLSKQGKNFVFICKLEGKYFAQSDDNIYGAFDSVENVTFRKEGKIFAFKSSTFSKKLGVIKDENQDSLYINNKILGPFTKIRDFKINDNLTYYIWYETFGNSYVIINNNKLGSFKSVYQVTMAQDGTSYALIYKDGGKKYLRINDEIFGGYEEIFDFVCDYEKGFTGFVFKNLSGEYYARINNTEIGPFGSCTGLNYFADINKYQIEYKKDAANFIQINESVFSGSDTYQVELINESLAVIKCFKDKLSSYNIVAWEIGSFNDVIEYRISNSGKKFIFVYVKFNQYFVVAGDYEYGPYKKVSNLSISPNGENYSFIFTNQHYNYYANINGNTYGPYILINETAVSDSPSAFGFIFQRNSKYFVNISDTIHGMYDSALNLKLSPDGSLYSYMFTKKIKINQLYSKLQSYLSLNGEVSENDIAIIDLQRNSMQIEAIVFKKNSKWYISLNETMFGPYDHIADWRFLTDETLFSFRFKNLQSDFYNLQINGRTYYSRNKNLQVHSPVFSRDGTKFAFIHYSDIHYYIQICDQTYGPFDHADLPTFSPDSKMAVFRYIESKKTYLNINGMKTGPFGVAEYTFSDGKLYTCYLQDKTIIIDEITW